MNIRNSILIIGIIITFTTSCEKDTNRPIERDGTAPGEIKNIVVESLAGAAKITYTLPSDPDVLYVEAVYTGKSGKKLEFKSSYYSNFVIVEGFADSTAYDVILRTADRSGNYSIPTTVQVTPKTPPVITAYKALDIKPDFGGVVINFKNKTKANLAVVVTTPDSTGRMTAVKTFYTSQDSVGFSVRGFHSKPRKFGVYVRDYWNNTSNVLEKELTPIFEIQLDKSKFTPLELPGDSPCTSWGGAMRYVWDGKVTGDIPNFGLHTGNASTGIPKIITFDTGVEAQLSRFSLQTVQDDRHWYNDVSPRRYEVWGALVPASDGSFTGWTKLLSITNIKPSGLPIGLFTDEDREAGRIGDEANFRTDIPKVRYIRIRCLENWSGNTNMVFSELTLWGNDK